jgi:2'-5' RNA ligase
MRTFIAIDLDREIKERLTSLIQELDKVSKKIKWVRKEGMHLTLKFLGEIEEKKIPEVESILKDISSTSPPFLLSLKGTGTFPRGRKTPRVLWVGIEESQGLKDLQSKLEEELEKRGFPREKREFHPHLTLGRVRRHSYLGGILSSLENNKEYDFGEMEVKKISFFQSVLKPTGAEYKILLEFDLQ